MLPGPYPIPHYPTDRICHFGDGLFETIAVIQGQPCLWQRHLQRLQRGCERLALPVVDEVALTRDAYRICAESCAGQARGVLKIILSAGHVERGYLRSDPVEPHYHLHCSPWPDGPLYQPDTPIHLQLCQTRLGSQPLLAGIKHLNRLEQVLARNELKPGMSEGVMLNQHGKVVEGTMSNLLVRYAGCYITPQIDDCGIAGIVRELLIEKAAEPGLALEIASVDVDMLKQADAVYIMNSLLGIRQVASYQGYDYAQAAMPVWMRDVASTCFQP